MDTGKNQSPGVCVLFLIFYDRVQVYPSVTDFLLKNNKGRILLSREIA
jgi:hypothetical protein